MDKFKHRKLNSIEKGIKEKKYMYRQWVAATVRQLVRPSGTTGLKWELREWKTERRE